MPQKPKPYIKQCAFWSKRIPQHTFATDNPKKEYCGQSHLNAAEAQRRRDRQHQARYPGWELPETAHVFLPITRRKNKEKPIIVGSSKIPIELVLRLTPNGNAPTADRCPICGAFTYDDDHCARNWLD